MALTDKFSAIGDAIREKTGKSDLLTLDAMPVEIASITTGGGGNEPTDEELTFSGNCDNLFRNGNWNWVIDRYSDRININNITNFSYGLSDMKKADLSILTIHTNNANFNGLFNNSNALEKLPKVAEGSSVMRYFTSMFSNCNRLLGDEINRFITSFEIPTNKDTNIAYNTIFNNCYSVRDLTPALEWLDRAINSYTGTSTSFVNYNQALNGLNALDKVTNMFVVRVGGARTSNAFTYAFNRCSRLKDIIFKLNNGVPYKVNWKSQTIDLAISQFVGYAADPSAITGYNSGITADKQVKDDATYQALKNDPDWFTCDLRYSRYNHDSAVNTINSLPDTSAYLATAGGTNTIKFYGDSGSLTDGGAINTLTEEEIAVAIAKGWTVTLS